MKQVRPKEIAHIECFEHLAAHAVTHLSELAAHGEIHQVCGPISTGGLGTRRLNNARFKRAIARVAAEGLVVFNQMSFQNRLVKLSKYPEPGYNELILENFYRPVFESGHVSVTLFLPDWETSYGARWERNLALERGIRIEEFPPHWLD